MKQVIQDVRSGVTAVRELPAPIATPGQVVIATSASLISAGTERYVVDLARKSLLGKARERPDQVRRVLQKLKQDGLKLTAQQVFAKLDEPMPLGYSAAGVVLECGRGVQELKPGDRVAAAAPHAGVVSVPKNLCAKIPDNVTFEQAAYAGVAAIALEGVRLAKVTLGERVLVIGLGLIGQMCVAMLKAQGCRVFGTDIDPAKIEQARAFGLDAGATGSPRDAIRAFSDGHGVDAVVITASTKSNEPIELAADVSRVRGRIVLVGVTGLEIPRTPFFLKELEFTVSFSIGPGRTDPSYEDRGVDYPVGHVRWTAQRNLQAVLDTISMGKLPVEKLTSHRFPVERAADAYDLITQNSEPFLGVVLEYEPVEAPLRRRIDIGKKSNGHAAAHSLGVSMIGAGNFARLVMMPLLKQIGGVEWRGLCTARGMNAEHSGRRLGYEYATTEFEEVLADKRTNAVFVATRHDLHADLVIAALRAGKHVFVEKPLCIRTDELQRIESCVLELGDRCPVLTVGFNRRFAAATERMRAFFSGAGPLSVSYRFAPGAIPASAWPQDEDAGGGRIVGEACHAIDTCAAIVGSPPMRVFAESVARADGLETTDDRVFITLRHENGSISNVSYQAGGDKTAPVERFEIHGGGRTASCDNWDRIDLWRDEKHTSESGGKDKGHAREFSAFVNACRTGAWPIPWADLYGTTWASLMAVQSLRDGMPITLE
jgi:predicted dehydrogenase